MPKEDMLEQIIRDFRALPDRKIPKNDDNIFGKHKFSVEEKELDLESKNDFDPFLRLPTENIIF